MLANSTLTVYGFERFVVFFLDFSYTESYFNSIRSGRQLGNNLIIVYTTTVNVEEINCKIMVAQNKKKID